MCKGPDLVDIGTAYFANPILGQAAVGAKALGPKPPKPQSFDPEAEDERLRTQAAQEAFAQSKRLKLNSLLSRAGGGAGDTSPPVLTSSTALAKLDLGS